MNKTMRQMRRRLLVALLTGLLVVGSFAAPGMVKTVSACQGTGGGGSC